MKCNGRSLVMFACGVWLAACDSKNPNLGEGVSTLNGIVTNSSSLVPPQLPAQLQAVVLWPTGEMSPAGVRYRATAVVDITGSGFPAEFTIALSAPPPVDVLAEYSSRGLHAVTGNVATIRMGSLTQSPPGASAVGACDVWG